MKQIKDILEKIYTNTDLRKSIVPLFIGNPGLGKTVFIEQFAKEKGVKLVELITSQMSPFEISGIAMPDKDSKKMTYYNFDKLENLKDGDILFFDELLNGNPVVLNACLTILEQRRFISGEPLPDIMIIAAANPQGMVPITPQIKERFVWYTTKYDKAMWYDYMVNKYQISKSIGNKLSLLIEKEEFVANNFYTPRSIDKAVNMIIYDVYTPYEEVIKPILSELNPNPFDEDIVLEKHKNGKPKKVLAKGEMISWLDLVRLKLGVKVDIVTEQPEDVFSLPKKWFITTTEVSIETIKTWAIDVMKYPADSDWRVGDYYTVDQDSIFRLHARGPVSGPWAFTEITFEQFKKYVLKENK